MYLLIIVNVIVVLCIIMRTFLKRPSRINTFVTWLGSITCFVLVILLIISLGTKLDTPVKVARHMYLQEQLGKVKRSTLLPYNVEVSIREMNESIVKCRALHNSLWVGYWYPKEIGELELLYFK